MVIHYGDKENQVKFEESHFFSKYSCKTAVLSRRVWVVTCPGHQLRDARRRGGHHPHQRPVLGIILRRKFPDFSHW